MNLQKNLRNRFSFPLLLLLAACTPRATENNPTSNLSPAERGKSLLTLKGCTACHSIDGSRMVGPSYKGLYGSSVKLADGSTVKADEAYLRESIENPQAKIVDGYPPSMPVYKGIVRDDEITAIIEYIKSLK